MAHPHHRQARVYLLASPDASCQTVIALSLGNGARLVRATLGKSIEVARGIKACSWPLEDPRPLGRTLPFLQPLPFSSSAAMFGTMSPASWFLVLFSAVASLSPVAAIVRPRVPTTFLGASYNHPISGALKFVNGTADLAVRANGCPTGWAPCSATTCYPLDGSECCSDGTFCTAGTVCQSGGCCPFGEICEGSAGPPITIGGGPVNDPTDTVTFVSDPTGTPTPTPTPSLTHTTTRAVTTIQTRSGTVTQTTGSPTTTHVTFTGTDSDTDTDTDTETIFHTSLGTESTTRTTGSALAGTDGSDALPTNPLSVGGVNGATPTVGGMQRACAVLSALTAIFMIIL